jgi:hypothetical protein
MPLRNKSTNDLLYSFNKNTFDDIKNKNCTSYNYHEIKDKYKKYDENNIISLKKIKIIILLIMLKKLKLMIVIIIIIKQALTIVRIIS